LPWYSCACCPPNIARLFASLNGYAATTDHGGLSIHQYAAGSIKTTVDGVPVEIGIRTEYPFDGQVELTVRAEAAFTLGLRIPGWCEGFSVRVDGRPVDAVAEEGYLRLHRDWSAGAVVTLDLPMPARVVTPHPRIDAVRGCAVLARGPLVYCLEQADLPEGVVLEDVRIDPRAPITVEPRADLRAVLLARGAVEAPAPDLYRTSTVDDKGVPVTITAVPYFLWGNRKPGSMRVWIPVTE
jgi:uncharacterized protein